MHSWAREGGSDRRQPQPPALLRGRLGKVRRRRAMGHSSRCCRSCCCSTGRLRCTTRSRPGSSDNRIDCHTSRCSTLSCSRRIGTPAGNRSDRPGIRCCTACRSNRNRPNRVSSLGSTRHWCRYRSNSRSCHHSHRSHSSCLSSSGHSSCRCNRCRYRYRCHMCPHSRPDHSSCRCSWGRTGIGPASCTSHSVHSCRSFRHNHRSRTLCHCRWADSRPRCSRRSGSSTSRSCPRSRRDHSSCRCSWGRTGIGPADRTRHSARSYHSYPRSRRDHTACRHTLPFAPPLALHPSSTPGRCAATSAPTPLRCRW